MALISKTMWLIAYDSQGRTLDRAKLTFEEFWRAEDDTSVTSWRFPITDTAAEAKARSEAMAIVRFTRSAHRHCEVSGTTQLVNVAYFVLYGNDNERRAGRQGRQSREVFITPYGVRANVEARNIVPSANRIELL